MRDQPKPTVVIVDDHVLLRSGVRAEIAAQLTVVGEAGTVAEAIGLIRARRVHWA